MSDIGAEVEEYLRGYSSYQPAEGWRVDWNDGVATLHLDTEEGETSLCMDKGGLKDLLDALELIYYTQ